MKGVVVCGKQGSGKTTFVKNKFLVSSKDIFVNDVNGEYEQPPHDIEIFLSEAKRRRNTIIIFEEATIFFSTRGRAEEVIELLVRARHTGNLCIFIFHSLRSIPVYIMELCSYIALFKTGDNAAVVNTKFKEFPELINTFKTVNSDSAPPYKYYICRTN